MSKNRYSYDDRACFFLAWQGDKRKEEGREKYVISLIKGLQEKRLHLFKYIIPQSDQTIKVP